jgi:hypothetical protein
MKKLIVAAILGGVLIVMTVGGTVFAMAPGESPVDKWDMILDNVNEVIGRIGEFSGEMFTTVAEGLESIYGAVDNVQDSVDEVENAVSDVSKAVADIQTSVDSLPTSATATTSDIGIVDNPNSTGFTKDEVVYESPVFFEGAHFHVTVYVSEIGSADLIRVSYTWTQEGGPGFSSSTHDMSVGMNTFEFDAAKCTISYLSNDEEVDPTDLYFGWAATVTYDPSGLME